MMMRLILRQLAVLLWKGTKLRLRHFIITAFEVVLPILLMSLLVYMRSMAGTTGTTSVLKPAQTFPEERIGYSRFSYKGTLLFTPPDTLLSRNITDMLKFKELKEWDMEPMPDEDTLVQRATQLLDDDTTSERVIGLVFQNDPSHSIPDTIRYKIRIRGYFNTERKTPAFGSTGYSEYKSSGFLGFQSLVDRTFMKLLKPDIDKLYEDAVPYTQILPYPSDYDSGLLSFLWFIPMMINQTLVIMAVVFVKRMVDEKANRAKELMRMMGMNDFVYYLGTWLVTFLVMGLVLTIMLILYKIPVAGDFSVITYCDGFLVWLILMIYAGSSLIFCMAIYTFFNRAVIAAIVVFIVWQITYTLPAFVMDTPADVNKYWDLTFSQKIGVCLLPNTALHFAFKIMAFYEATGEGSNWSNLFTPMHGDNLSLGVVVIMFFVSGIVFSFIIWYVDNVWPWQFGIPKHPLFFLMPSYWRPKKTKMGKNLLLEEEDATPVADTEYFEEEPGDKVPGISVNNLTKAFGWGKNRKLAVNNVSLNIYQGEITALLGHNGAGKTTTMNIITGLFPPSSGSAVVNGYNVLENLKQARGSLGLCPQHNVLYENLTVEEHLTLFAGLKGRTFAQIKGDINFCLELLQLQPKRNDLARTLSGGMKRKLSLGIAMIGGSKVLVLDEPTSGMDPQARRAIWDLLHQIKHERTILLTTHYMEEADILGDRIAIMADGVMQCCGSPLFLKRKFGAGYHLRVSKGDTFKEHALDQLVKESVPTAYVVSNMRTEIGYVLPSTDSQPFVGMFESLEANKNQIGYTACGLTITTMEDVFIKVGKLAEKAQENNGFNDTSHSTTQASPSAITSRPAFLVDKNELLKGSQLLFQQALALLVKRFHDTKRYWVFIVFLLALPLIINFMMLKMKNDIFMLEADDMPKELSLNLQGIFGKTIAYRMDNNSDGMGTELLKELETVYKRAGAEDSPITTNLSESVIPVGEENRQKYRDKFIVAGVTGNDSDDYYHPGKTFLKLTSVYSQAVYHSEPISLNLMDVALLKLATGNKNADIYVTNAPLPNKHYTTPVSMNPINDVMGRLIMCIFMPLALAFLSASFVLFPIHERQTKSKLIQLMTGVDGTIFWLTHLIWDFGLHLVASCFMLIPFATLDVLGAYTSGALGALFGMLLLYGWASIPLSYLLSFISNKPSTGFVVVAAINFVTGIFASIGVSIYKIIAVQSRYSDHSEAVAWVFRIMPCFAMSWGTANLDSLARQHTRCDINGETINIPYCDVGLSSMEEQGCGRDMLFLFLSGCIFIFILIALENNLIRFWYRVRDGGKQTRQQQQQQQQQQTFQINLNSQLIPMGSALGELEDSDVAAERSRVTQQFQQNDTHQDAIMAKDLSKSFGNIVAVQRVTFGVHHNECFGLLGVNGAGKTTTFSMLTGDLALDDGTAVIGQYNVRDDLKTFRSLLGYCPQFDALLDRLTCREAMFLFARLRGIQQASIPRVISSLIELVDLQKHADKRADQCSGGNRRKLSLALALIGSPPVVFLDEPTAGIDPASRRKIWNAFVQVQQAGASSFILTTHSMEECEALCGRLVIMVNGQFRCLGAIQYLKSKFGQGYTIIVKLNKSQSMDPEATQAVQQFFHTTFQGCELKDIHEGMLHYHIADLRYTWSFLFREMEKAKQTFNLEDYFISDTTLEQIFLAFARSQRIVATP